MLEYIVIIKYKHHVSTKEIEDFYSYIDELHKDKDNIQRARIFRSSDLEEVFDVSNGDLETVERVTEEG